MQFTRPTHEPILSPKPEHAWESLASTNPAAWYDEARGEVTMLYRAAGHDDEHRVYFGLARSKDGITFERVSDVPVFGPAAEGFDAGCVEDPRIVKFGEDYFVTYACRPFAPGTYWENPGHQADAPLRERTDYPFAVRENATSSALAITRDFKTWTRAGRLTDPTVDDRDVMIFPEKIGNRFATLHRPLSWCGEGFENRFPAIWIALCDDLLEPKKLHLLAQAQFDWECKIGGSTPPLRTDAGWLTLYHGVGPDKHYRIGAMLLDLDDPTRVLHRSPDWLFQPELPWELEGIYNGVVFPCGNVIIGNTLHVYYGGGDIHCGVCTCDLQELLDYLVGCPA